MFNTSFYNFKFSALKFFFYIFHRLHPRCVGADRTGSYYAEFAGGIHKTAGLRRNAYLAPGIICYFFADDFTSRRDTRSGGSMASVIPMGRYDALGDQGTGLV